MASSNPMDMFFKLGDKATGGDPIRKADFDYYLLWIIFLAFALIAITNYMAWWETGNLSSLGWGVVITAILWFQYSALKMSYDARKLMRKVKDASNFNEVEDIDEMMELMAEEAETGVKPKKSKRGKKGGK